MFERFTEKAIKTIMLAQEEARRLGHNFVGTEQILLGLIGEGTGVAATVLKSMGVNLRDARIEVEKIIGRGSGFVAAEIPFTPRAKRILELSQEEARQLDHGYIGTEHLLLGLIREGEGVAARVLENLGVDLSRARAQVLYTLEETANRAVSEKAAPEESSSVTADSSRFKVRRLPNNQPTSTSQADSPDTNPQRGSTEATNRTSNAVSSESEINPTDNRLTGGYFPTANRVLAFLGSVLGTESVDAVAVCRGPEEFWWVEVPVAPNRSADLIRAAGGRGFARRGEDWVTLIPGKNKIPATEGEQLDASAWPSLELSDVLSQVSLLASRYRGATVLLAAVPSALGAWVLRRAIALRLETRVIPAVWQPLSDGSAAESGVLLIQVQSRGDRDIPASFVKRLTNLPNVLVAEPIVAGETGSILVDVRHRLPIAPSLLADLIPRNQLWVLGPPDIGFWQVQITGEAVDGEMLVAASNETNISASAPSQAKVNLPKALPVRLVDYPGVGQRVDAVLVDDAELGWLRTLLVSRPVGEIAFLLPGAGCHLLTAPGGLPSSVPFGIPLTWTGPGGLYLQIGTTFYPPLSTDARHQRYAMDEESVIAVVRDTTYRFDVSKLIPAWSLWIGEVPVVQSGISTAGEQLLAQISPEIQPKKELEKGKRLVTTPTNHSQVEAVEIKEEVGILEQAQQAELEGNLLYAAELLEKGGYPGQAGRLYERAAKMSTT